MSRARGETESRENTESQETERGKGKEWSKMLCADRVCGKGEQKSEGRYQYSRIGCRERVKRPPRRQSVGEDSRIMRPGYMRISHHPSSFAKHPQPMQCHRPSVCPTHLAHRTSQAHLVSQIVSLMARQSTHSCSIRSPRHAWQAAQSTFVFSGSSTSRSSPSPMSARAPHAK